MDWKFKDEKNTAVITLKSILNDEEDVLFVSHDADDGGWQFLAGANTAELVPDDAAVVSLSEMVASDPSLGELWDLPVGFAAYRSSKDDLWDKKPA